MIVSEVMTKEVITISSEASLKEAGELFKTKRVGGVPVVDGSGKVIGVITITDMMKILGHIYDLKERERKDTPEVMISEMYEEEKQNAKVSDVMTQDVYVLNEERSIEEVMRLMFRNKVHTIPITNNDGKLIGIIGRHDLINACF